MEVKRDSSYIPGLTIKQMNQIIMQEGLDDSIIDSGSTARGMIRFYDDACPGLYHVEVNGEREPLLEYHRITEEDACNMILQILRNERSHSDTLNG